MAKFNTFKIIAERSNGTYAKFMIREGDKTPRPEIGTTHDAAFTAETELYNMLVELFQGTGEE